jgi:hypothetical protein
MNNCDGSINEKLVIAATNFARQLLKVDNALWVFINDGELFKSVNYSGMFENEMFVIRYNREWLKTADNDKIIKCAFHETFHAVQYSAVIGYGMGVKNNLFRDDEMKKLIHEFNAENYDDSTEVWGTHLVEQQAEAFALELYEKFINQFKNTEDFIDRYYQMYPNIE